MRKHAIVLTALMLAACQTAAPSYRPATTAGGVGYFSAPTANGRHLVAYTGAKNVSAAQVAELALLRAAELTLETGGEWFAVIDTISEQVRIGDINDIRGRSGPVLTSQGATASPGGGSDSPAPGSGVVDGSVPGGPSIGGFGGGDVPYQVIERWRPQTVNRTRIVIQTGSGDRAAFSGLEAAPQIYSARATADEIRAKLAR